MSENDTCNTLYLATNTDYDTAVTTLSTPCTAEEWQAMVWWLEKHAPEHEKQALQNGWSKNSWIRWNTSRYDIHRSITNVILHPSVLGDNKQAMDAKFFWAYLILSTYKRFRPFITQYNTGAMNIAAKYDLYLNAMVEMLMYRVMDVAETISQDVRECIREERQQKTNSAEAD